MSAAAGLLDGIRVLEFGQIAAGPFAGMLLADLGADVVKVEPPAGGDSMRGWPPLLAGDSGAAFSANFASLNRNKRSVAVDLKDPAGAARVRRLCERTDVLIENYRPGVLERLGLGYETLSGPNPRLVYCSLSGYGQEGPLAQKGAFDVTVQAISGLMSVTGEEERPPAKCGVPVGDFACGLYAAYSVLAALRRVTAGGSGCRLDCSMLGGLLAVSALQVSEYFGTGVAPRRLGSAHPRNAPYEAFEASDQPVVVAAGTDDLWRRLCAVLGADGLSDDERYRTQELRAANQRELAAALAPLFAARTADEWLRALDEAGIPCAPINTYADILAEPHVADAGWLTAVGLPNGAETTTMRYPVQVDGELPEITRRPPALGEHTEEVFSDWIGAAA